MTAPLIGYLRQIIAELQAHDTDFETRCAGLMLCLFSEIPRRMSADVPADAEALLRYLEQNYRKPLRGPEYDMLTCGDARGIERRFRKLTGMTPARYQRLLRLNDASRLLLETGMTIRQVAETVGYQDPLYFSRLFTRFYGKSPTEHRK